MNTILSYVKENQGILIQFSMADKKFKLDTVPKNKQLEDELMVVDIKKPIQKIRDRKLFVKLLDHEMNIHGFDRL